MNIIPETIDDLTDLFMTALPKGQLYGGDETFRSFVKGLLTPFKTYLDKTQSAIRDQFTIDEENEYLDENLVMYGLPNVIFPSFSSNAEKAFAISMMKAARNLKSKADFENFMLALGIEVKFYQLNVELKDHLGFGYGFPAAFSPATTTKNKLTYLIWVNESQETVDNIQNLGNAFPIQFTQVPNNLLEVKKILDYLKPGYLIFQYINTNIKNLYNLA